MIDRAQLKTMAKDQIKGNVWLYLGLSLVISLILSAVSFTVVGAIVLNGPLQLGLVMFTLEIVRTKKGTFETGFNGFKQFGSSLVASLIMMVCTILWSLLLIVPGIIAAIRYSMTYYILADNPEMSGSDAVNKSKEMMKGHKWEFFVLGLSFIPWHLLGIITLGIAYIWICPYMSATFANYYEVLKNETPVNA